MSNTSWYGMHQRDNRIWLKRFIKHFKLTRPEIAKHCSVNLSTVDRWLVPPDRSSHRKMPNMARDLLVCLESKGIIKD